MTARGSFACACILAKLAAALLGAADLAQQRSGRPPRLRAPQFYTAKASCDSEVMKQAGGPSGGPTPVDAAHCGERTACHAEIGRCCPVASPSGGLWGRAAALASLGLGGLPGAVRMPLARQRLPIGPRVEDTRLHPDRLEQICGALHRELA
jgi:hypothetical protein